MAVFWVLLHFCSTQLFQSTNCTPILVPCCTDFRSWTRTVNLQLEETIWDHLPFPQSLVCPRHCLVLWRICILHEWCFKEYREQFPSACHCRKTCNKHLLYLLVPGFMGMLLDCPSSLIMYLWFGLRAQDSALCLFCDETNLDQPQTPADLLVVVLCISGSGKS